MNYDSFNEGLFFLSHDDNSEITQNMNSQYNEQKSEGDISNVRNNAKKQGEENKKPIYDRCTAPTFNLQYEQNDFREEENEKEDKKLIGKKRNKIVTGAHNKFSDDNIRRKVKHLVLKSLMDFINIKIVDIYNGDIGNGIFKKELLTINQKQKSDATIEFNQQFLHKRISDIFSENISTRFTIYPLDHNKTIINNLMNEEDNYKRIYFNSLFNLTFLDCLEHFRGTKEIEVLKGSKGFQDIKNVFLEEPDYLEALTFYIMNYKDIINSKRKRNRNKKTKNYKNLEIEIN